MPTLRRAVRLGTRASRLATTQSGWVADRLGVPVELVQVRTEGDRLTGSLAALGGAGVFVAALREAVLDGRCDLAVHSLKDLPTAPAPGLVVAAVPEREDPRDALCARDGLRLADLPHGARVGTGSPRRAAQLRAVRPDLDVVDIRGNVDTRLGRVPGTGPGGTTTGPGDIDAVVLAAAGLARIGRLDAVTELLDPAVVAPAPGQGALAVEVRAAGPDRAALPGPADATDDDALLRAVRALDHRPTRLAVTAERALLAALEAGCAAPVGTLARLVPGPAGADAAGAEDSGGTVGAALVLDAVVAAVDGSRVVRTSARVTLPARHDGTGAATVAELAAADALGRDLAARLLADGAADLAPLGPGGARPTPPGAP